MSFSTKDPSESIVVTFDFSALVSSISTATVTNAADEGNDAAPASMLSGAPLVTGTKVSQRLVGGVAGCTYHLRCTVTDDGGNTYVLANTLPVSLF